MVFFLEYRFVFLVKSVSFLLNVPFAMVILELNQSQAISPHCCYVDEHKILNQAITLISGRWIKKPIFMYLSLRYLYNQQILHVVSHVLKKISVHITVCLLPSSELDHVGIFSRRTTPNCNSNQYLALCFAAAPRSCGPRLCGAGRTAKC